MSSDDGYGYMEERLLSPVTYGVAEASDRSVARAMVEAEIGLLRAFVAAGVAPESVGEAAFAMIREPWFDLDVRALARDAVADGNPVIPLIPLVRARVAQIDPDAAAWVHRGATSQDILDTALMLVGRQVSDRLQDHLRAAEGALMALAQRHRDDPAAARTLTQHAVPTTLGLRAATWMRGLGDARRRLSEVADRLPAQLGGAGGTLAAFVELFGESVAAELPARFAEVLNLRAPEGPWHTDRRPITELGDALAALVAAVGVFATDVAQLARTEVGEASVAAGGGSSAMPQKQNPVDAVLIRSAAMRAPGLAAQLHLAAGLAVDERPDGAWHAEWPALQELMQLALGACAHAATLAAGLTLNADRARANLGLSHGLIVSERLAIVLVPVIGRARFDELIVAASTGADLAALLRALPEAADLDVDALLDPGQYTGVAGRLVDQAIRRAMQDGIRP
ncbi:lyase family protein [Microbacterium sp. ASV49]|uniref:Lyase family protein n=1 Tax=Microbacterium candidum TaxID=3041922 RepID=A0ABT7MVL6_9MICO|nr:lyase family protein [Microbacterium sp. ASV49]MDL9978483.1 lyase family protein [Microbacterium sp. ASV49]